MRTLEEIIASRKQLRKEIEEDRKNDRHKAFIKWRRNQILPSIKRYGLDKYPTVYFEKCPYCRGDLTSIFLPNPIIKAFRKKRRKSLKGYGRSYFPCVFIFKCLVCGKKSADYRRYYFIAEDFLIKIKREELK